MVWGNSIRRPKPTDSAVLSGLALLALGLARAPLRWVTDIVVGISLTILITVRPVAGLVVMALLIPLGDFLPLPIPGVNIIDLLVALTLAGWLMCGIAQRKIIFRPPPLTWPILALIWIGALTLTQATSWREGLPEWLKWAEFAVLYLVATQILTRRQVWWVIGGLFASGVLEVALGAYQFTHQAGPEPFILMGRFMRAYGTFRQPNPYAGYLGYLAPVATSLALGGLGRWWSQRRNADLWLGLACGSIALALMAGIGMSWSRGGWLGLAAGLVVVIGLRNRRAATLTIIALLVLALVVVLVGTGWLPNIISARLNDLGNYFVAPDPSRVEITDANFSVLERLAHWQIGLRMFDDHPWLGVGIGNYAVAYTQYALPHWYEALGHAHNVYINFLAETGVLGTGAFAVFWLGAAWLAWRTVARSTGNRAALAIGLLGTLTYLSVHNLFDNLFVQHMQLQLALLLSGLVATENK